MNNTLPCLISPLLATPHGFFTRLGGVSEGMYASLNASYGSRDNKAHVTENRARIAAQFGKENQDIVTLHQVHSDVCVIVESRKTLPFDCKADALVTNQAGILLGVLTADCVPLLLHDPDAGVIGACHAGWKGALLGIVESTIEAMQQLGATPANIRAATGASIAQQSYEVDKPFYTEFMAQSSENAAYFIPSPTHSATHYVYDNKGYVQDKLLNAGLQAAHIEICADDTYADAARYFSFRRATHASEEDYGRQISVISL
jgi:YfiH family protein